MDDAHNLNPPASLQEIEAATKAIGFTMASDHLTGALLRTLVATKPAGNFLELGTGTGLATAWIMDGMDTHAKLQTVDHDEALVTIAKCFLADDARVTFHLTDGGDFIQALTPQQQKFDLIFADTWAGKYTHLDEALALLNPGGIYLIDDLLPQPNWPEDHPPKVAQLIATLEQKENLRVTKVNWSTGLLIAVKVN